MFVVSLAWSGMAQADLIVATAAMDFGQEVNPVNPAPSSATGYARIEFDTGSNRLSLSATVDGIFLADITFPGGPLAFSGIGPLHIHQAPAGANGGVVVPFPSQSFFSETATGLSIAATDIAFAPDLLEELAAGGLYLNLHTLDYPSGEIRGQLAIVAQVPEPGVLSLFLLGLIAFAGVKRSTAVPV